MGDKIVKLEGQIDGSVISATKFDIMVMSVYLLK
jgi:hypothetical protein